MIKKKAKLTMVIFTVALLGAFAIHSLHHEARASKKSKVKWYTITKGLKVMPKRKKPALIFFHTDWCHYCSKMEQETLASPEVTAYLNRYFTNIKVNPEKERSKIKIKTLNQKITPMELFRGAGGRGFPTVLFFDRKGNPITSLPGYLDKETFLLFIKYINRSCYKRNISFRDYKNKPSICEKN